MMVTRFLLLVAGHILGQHLPSFSTELVSSILRSTFRLISDIFQSASWKTRTELKDSVGTDTLELFVRFGKTFTVSVGQSATVKTLKKQIQIKTGISVTDQVLTTGSRNMVDWAKLSCYNLCNNTTLHLTLRLRGGCDTKKLKLDQKAASFEKKDVEFIDLLDIDSDCDSDSPLFSDPVEEIPRDCNEFSVSRPNSLPLLGGNGVKAKRQKVDQKAASFEILCESNELPNFNHFIHFWPFTFSLQYRDRCQQRQ